MDIQTFLSRGRGQGRRATDRIKQFTTLIGPETRLMGRLHGGENCIVNGTVEGDGELDGVLVLGEQGSWRGNINAATAIIAGTVNGDISVREKLELTASARVTGSISSPMVAMAEGAVHQGGIQMGKDAAVSRYQEKRKGERTP